MVDFNGFKGAAKRLEDIDLPRIGHSIGVGEDELHAFMDTEAAGSGFDSQGRPKMLFEPHVFYRNLTGAQRTAAVQQGLAYAKWKPGAYPRDSYPRLMRAMRINETAALKASSWGLGQILGENHRMVGYATVQQMVFAMMADEEKHLEAMVAYLVSARLDDDMRDLAALTRKTLPADTAPIVRVYNGPGYKANRYDVKFANAHNKWRSIPDTPWTPEGGDLTVPPPPPIGPVDRLSIIREGQALLKQLGYEPGPIDGKNGPKTEAATEAYQKTIPGLKVDGKLGPLTLAKLRISAAERAAATPTSFVIKGVGGADSLDGKET